MKYFTGTNQVFAWTVSLSLLQDPCGMWFCLLTRFCTLDLSLLVCSSVTSKFTVCIVAVIHVRYYLFSFTIPKTSFVQLQVRISLTSCGWVCVCGVCSAKAVPTHVSCLYTVCAPCLWLHRWLWNGSFGIMVCEGCFRDELGHCRPSDLSECWVSLDWQYLNFIVKGEGWS